MADGLVLPPGAGHRIQGAGMTLKVGAEQYLEGIAELLSHPGPPDQGAIIELRARYDIEQLTSMIPGRRLGPERGGTGTDRPA